MRFAIDLLLEHPVYLDPLKIDADLLIEPAVPEGQEDEKPPRCDKAEPRGAVGIPLRQSGTSAPRCHPPEFGEIVKAHAQAIRRSQPFPFSRENLSQCKPLAADGGNEAVHSGAEESPTSGQLLARIHLPFRDGIARLAAVDMFTTIIDGRSTFATHRFPPRPEVRRRPPEQHREHLSPPMS
nr:hypothetical protein [Rhizobium ruizarguesonis]